VYSASHDIATIYHASSDKNEADEDGVWRNDPERIANANLIAAAPEMLAALQMAKHIVANEGTDEQMRQVFAAIEKATGEKA
jgi:hypothetical protein